MVGTPHDASVHSSILEGGFEAFGQALEFVDGCNGGAGGPLRVCACGAERRGDQDTRGASFLPLPKVLGPPHSPTALGRCSRVSQAILMPSASQYLFSPCLKRRGTLCAHRRWQNFRQSTRLVCSRLCACPSVTLCRAKHRVP